MWLKWETIKNGNPVTILWTLTFDELVIQFVCAQKKTIFTCCCSDAIKTLRDNKREIMRTLINKKTTAASCCCPFTYKQTGHNISSKSIINCWNLCTRDDDVFETFSCLIRNSVAYCTLFSQVRTRWVTMLNKTVTSGHVIRGLPYIRKHWQYVTQFDNAVSRYFDPFLQSNWMWQVPTWSSCGFINDDSAHNAFSCEFIQLSWYTQSSMHSREFV